MVHVVITMLLLDSYLHVLFAVFADAEESP